MTGAEQKIERSHLERLAVVYLRQSSPRQLRENFRSTERQYALSDEAVRLGWDQERVITADGDLGVSGRFSDTQARGAFKDLLARVCLGEVGAVFGLEVSRLARSSAEIQRLLEYCALTDTLVIDTDGIYDLRDFNDQLVLGVKSQVAQAELHVMGVRLQGARRHAAERGELRCPLPTGLVYDAEGNTIIDPDEQVKAAICDVFKAFWQAGSAYGVVGVFKGRRFPRRAHGGGCADELRWGALSHARVLEILRNPSYAGAYVFGRYHSRRVLKPDGTIVTKTIELPRSDWAVVIQDHHEGYISWEQFLSNEQRLAQNATRNGARPPREGNALCQGIVRCGSCGRSMATIHGRKASYYYCSRSRADRVDTDACRWVTVRVVDQLVARRLLEALEPEEIALALAAADEHADRRARSDRARELRVERARYEAIRSERAFHACEPDNRLVARTLENRWEEKLRELKDAEAELAEHVVPGSKPCREQIEALARNLPALWTAKTTAERDRKRLLRALISDVTITSQPDRRELQVGIHWQSGAAEQHTIQRPQTRTTPEAIQLARGLAATHTNVQIAEHLNAAGLCTSNDEPFTATHVQWIRWAHKIPYPADYARDGELTVDQVAERLGISTWAVRGWISTGKLAARRGPGNRLYIPLPPQVEQQCHQLITNSVHIPHHKPKSSLAGGAV
jgi:DNA invertase Pin-like site-specific DNA recombinase